MAQVRFLNRNRPNWLWAFSVVGLTVASLSGVTILTGCGNTPTSVLNSTVTGLKAGIYNGTVACTYTQLIGSVSTQDQTTEPRNVTVDESGMPLTNGQPVAVGATSAISYGEVSGAARVTNVTVSNNGVIVKFDVYITLPGRCLDTCQYAYDGECDDGGSGAVTNACPYGTDCSDCGQIPGELAGQVTRTFKHGAGNQVDFTESWVASLSNEFFTGSGTVECSGILAR